MNNDDSSLQCKCGGNLTPRAYIVKCDGCGKSYQRPYEKKRDSSGTVADYSAPGARGFWIEFESDDGSHVAHINGDPDMSAETLNALKKALQQAADAAQRGELETLCET